MAYRFDGSFLQREDSYYVPFLQPSQGIKKFVTLLTLEVQVIHHVPNRNTSVSKIFVFLVKVLYNRFLKFSAPPCRVSNQENNGS